MTPTLRAEPDRARPTRAAEAAGGDRPLLAERRAFHEIDPAAWDQLAALNPCATPFSAWAFQRAWWDAYGENAHDETLVVVDPGTGGEPDRLVAIVPLMDRHVVEPSDAATHTTIRHADPATLTPIPPSACAVYFGASYHADYATVLADPRDLPRAAEALAEAFAQDKVTPKPTAADPNHPEPWAAIDLRRLRQADPAAEALAAAFGNHEMAAGWTLNVEREDVCPVITIPQGADIDGLLATLGKKERHEIRRKVRRAEAAGAVELVESTDPVADLDAFIDLHQARWGALGLFPPTPGGDQSRRFVRRLFELFAARRQPTGWSVHLGFLTVAGRRIGAEIHFETADSILYYNAGVDPEARDFSPGVVLLERLVRRAVQRGKPRVDLLRGNEPYKYEWGAVDEPIQRILVRRTAALA